MINKKKYVEYVIDKIALLRAEISSLNKQGYNDANLYCENIVKNIMNIVYDYDLINLNSIKNNYPGVDLGDYQKKIAVQVTSTKTSQKVNKSLEKIEDNNIRDDFDIIYIFILTKKQSTYKINEEYRSFDYKKYIIDFDDIIDEFINLNTLTMHKLYHIFEVEFCDTANSIRTREIILFMVNDFSRNQLKKQIASSKYIPDVFTEISKIKDKLRYFLIPQFYYKALSNIPSGVEDYYNKAFIEFGLNTIKTTVKIIEPKSTIELIDCCIEELSILQEVNVLLNNKLESLGKIIIPMIKENSTPKIAYHYFHDCNYSFREFNDVIKQLTLIKNRVLIFTSIAGKGKTNLICDLIDKVLLPREIPNIFICGNELNAVDLDYIDDYLLKRIFNGQYFNKFIDFAIYYENIFEITGKYLVIIIDGINEVNNLSIFPGKLEIFIESLMNFRFIKVILTCRTEFFKERFENFNRASFYDNLGIIKDFDHEMDEIERELLFDAYLQHYKLDFDDLSTNIYEKLTKDPLLLRLFCEANGNPNVDEVKIIPRMTNLNRAKTFSKYLELLIVKFNNIDNEHVQRLRRSPSYLKSIFNKIIIFMITNCNFSIIKICELNLSNVEENCLERLIDENIILRKDLSKECSIFSKLNDYSLSFTYDEFRDFLISDYILNIYKDDQELESVINTFLKPEYPIFEGVTKYLFHISKQNSHRHYELLKTYSWFDDLFANEIFEVDNEFILGEDINKIMNDISTCKKHYIHYILLLIKRHNLNDYNKLNIKIIFSIIENISEEEYNNIFRDLFNCSEGQQYFRQEGKLELNSLFDYLSKRVEEGKIVRNTVTLFEFLIILFGSSNYRVKQKAISLYFSFIKKRNNIAMRILHNYHKSIHIQSILQEIDTLLKL